MHAQRDSVLVILFVCLSVNVAGTVKTNEHIVTFFHALTAASF